MQPLVLLVAGRLEPRGRSRYTLRLAEHLPSSGFGVEVICRGGELLAEWPVRSCAVLERPDLDLPLWNQWVRRELLYRERSQWPDLVHAQTPDEAPLADWLARRFRVPLVVTAPDFLPPMRGFSFRPRYGGRIVAVSRAVKADLSRRRSITADSVKVIPSGVELVDLPGNLGTRDPSAPPGLDSIPPPEMRIPVVGTVGPLERAKGLDFLLLAARELISSGHNAHFVIAGRGPEEARLRLMARDLRLTNRLTFVSDLQEFPLALQAIDVFCLPSLQQGLGSVMLEAMVRRKAVVASRVGGPAEIIKDGETGLLVPPGDPEALGKAVRGLLCDPDLMIRLGEAGRRLVADQFTVERMVQDTAGLYRKLLSRQPVAA